MRIVCLCTALNHLIRRLYDYKKGRKNATALRTIKLTGKSIYQMVT